MSFNEAMAIKIAVENVFAKSPVTSDCEWSREESGMRRTERGEAKPRTARK